MPKPITPLLTVRNFRAFEFAAGAHGSPFRKGTTIPYIAHPLAVSALVIEHQGDEDEAIAGLLHNARAIRQDLLVHGDEIWRRFNAGPKDLAWYYGALVPALRARLSGTAGAPLVDALEGTLRAIWPGGAATRPIDMPATGSNSLSAALSRSA